ncbi:MAG: D-alanyl-D-alanine carboxypeptidase [Clostridia bacterium]
MKKLISILLLSIIISSITYSVSAEGFPSTVEGTCKSYIMVTMEEGDVVYANNADEELPMASLTKIITYIVAYENIPDIQNTVITVTQDVSDILESTNSSLANIKVGEELTAYELLNLMLVPSGNDAALALALYYDSTQGYYSENTNTSGADSRAYDMTGSPFVALMNEKAAELGCENTNFTNPHGLYCEDHYSTARDLAVLTRYATTLPYFTEITSQLYYTLEPTNMRTKELTVYTSNKMLTSYSTSGTSYYYKYATGIKTGSLTESGYCLASSATYNGYSYIIIALGADMEDDEGNTLDNAAMIDSANLYRWAFLNLEDQTVVSAGTLLGDVIVEYAWDQSILQVVAEENVRILLPSSLSLSSITVTLDLPDEVQAPISQGDIIGIATFTYEGTELATVNVVASESVDRSQLIHTIEVGKDVISSPIFIGVICAIIVILILYITVSVMYNKKRSKSRSRKFKG